MAENKIWRVHLFCDTKIDIEGQTCRRYCIDKNIIGLGWRIDSDDLSVKALKEMRTGDYVWTRNKGQYYIGRICDDCAHEFSLNFGAADKDKLQYDINDDILQNKRYDKNTLKIAAQKWKNKEDINEIEQIIREQNYESINVHRMVEKWYFCKDYEVPGKVINNFNTSKTVNGVHDSLWKYCAFLYQRKEAEDQKKEMPKEIPFKTDNEKFETFKNLLHYEDTEDLPGIWLQQKRAYLIFPSTNKQATKDFEYILIKKDGTKKAIIQCKSGGDDIDLEIFDDYKKEYDIYLFVVDGCLKRNNREVHLKDENILEIKDYDIDYPESKDFQIYKVDLKYLFAWARENKNILTDRIRHYLDITGY